MTVTIWVLACLPGYHRWPGAPGHRAYLASPHRHLFHVKVTAAVAHDDRDLEFHDLRDLVTAWWGPGDRDWGPASCETIARHLAACLSDQGITVITVEVSEDGEAGAVISWHDDNIPASVVPAQPAGR